MPTVKITKRIIDAFEVSGASQDFLWDSELGGFGVRALRSGLKTFIVQYRSVEGVKRRINLGRFGVLTVEQARDRARAKLGEVASGLDPAVKLHELRKTLTVAEMCDWYLEEARAGNILGRKNRPIKASSLTMDESRINTHIKPLLSAPARKTNATRNLTPLEITSIGPAAASPDRQRLPARTIPKLIYP